MPNDEPLEYLVTQAIADFLANRSVLELDGIAYPSVQDPYGGRNVILLHKAARVERMDFSEGTRIETHSMLLEDDDREVEYWISIEEGPPMEDEKDLSSATAPSVARMLESSRAAASEDDLRESTLRLDPDSLTVHRVNSVKYHAHARQVDRHVLKREEFESS